MTRGERKFLILSHGWVKGLVRGHVGNAIGWIVENALLILMGATNVGRRGIWLEISPTRGLVIIMALQIYKVGLPAIEKGSHGKFQRRPRGEERGEESGADTSESEGMSEADEAVKTLDVVVEICI
ncbi:hypothetical protein L6452_33998 [Arctium lappa]|uniref:Uncharacterized protein n=1 Tax=Arctium lappa TaxID=4217 RepID=A0ACB8YGD7_ARCLA|nr:hypothetical protein L6452_33998 [Arctium lappa]